MALGADRSRPLRTPYSRVRGRAAYASLHVQRKTSTFNGLQPVERACTPLNVTSQTRVYDAIRGSGAEYDDQRRRSSASTSA